MLGPGAAGERRPASVAICLTDPRAIEHRSANAYWCASEVPEDQLFMAATKTDLGAAVTELCRRFRSSSVTVVSTQNGVPHLLISAKGLAGSHERFHASMDNRWYVTDHFRNAISQVPVASRTPSELATAEHYIFRAVHADQTYSQAVDRVTHGEMVTVDLSTGSVSRQLIDRYEPPEDRLDRPGAIDRLDRALETATTLDSKSGRTALLFSGGVDSTVLLTYLYPNATPVTWVPDTPEFAIETEYARSAAALLDATVEEILVNEADVVTLLEESTKLMGWPAMHSGTPMFGVAYDAPFDTFFVGEGADALFGVGMRLATVSNWLANPVAIKVLGQARQKGPSRLRHRFDQLHDAALRLARPVGPRSYALGNAGAPVADDVAAALNTDTVLAALQARIDYVDKRLDIETAPDDRGGRNLEYRHWVYALGDAFIMGRHQAQGRGKALVNPFGSAAVVETALAVPPKIRYARGLRGKWMVKEVLKKRLPTYPIDRHKKHTAMPFERFYETGPMRSIWDRYDVPAVFTGKAKDEMVAGNGLTWQAVAYAIWKAQVGDDVSLTPHQGSVHVELE